MSIWHDLHGVDVAPVAAALGLTQGRRGSWGPCPSCGATSRDARSGRGPIGTTGRPGMWGCYRCRAGGDAGRLVAWVLTGAPDPTPETSATVERWAAGCMGVTPSTPLERAPEVEPVYLDPDDLAHALRGRQPSPAARAWLRSRGLPSSVLGRALAVEVGPPTRPDDPLIRPWWPVSLRGDYQLAAPLWSPDGHARGLHARLTSGWTGAPKTRSAEGVTTAGLWLADAAAVRWMRGEPCAGVVVAEGITDWLRVCTFAPPEWAVVGVLSGSLSSAGRLPWSSLSEVLVATDADPAGDRYAAGMMATVPWAVRLRPPEGLDVDDCCRSWADLRGLTFR